MNTNDNRPSRPQNRPSQSRNPNSRPRQERYEAAENRDDYYEERRPQPPRGRQPRREQEEYYEDDYDHNYHQQDYSPRRQVRKPSNHLLVGLIAVAVVAVAAGSYMLFAGNSDAEIIAISPNYVTTQQPYQDCRRVGTTTYVKNQKNGTEGALIGGATGAVAGGIVGNQVHGGGGGTAVGAVVGGATGALVGRQIQRSNQPDYVAKKGSTTKCATAYRNVQTQIGYNAQYMYKNNVATMVVQNQLPVGTKIPYKQLQAMALPPQQLNPVQTTPQ